MCNPNQDDVVTIDSLAINKICFHRNMSLVDSSYHPIIVPQLKLAIDSISKHIRVCDVEFRVLVFRNGQFPGWE